MSELLTLQDLANGHLDIKALGEAANGDENTIVATRTGNTYPSAKKAIKTMFENGGLPAIPFATKALMTASALMDGKYAQVTDDTVNNGLYVKTSGAWVKSTYDPFGYTDKNTRIIRGGINLDNYEAELAYNGNNGVWIFNNETLQGKAIKVNPTKRYEVYASLTADTHVGIIESSSIRELKNLNVESGRAELRTTILKGTSAIIDMKGRSFLWVSVVDNNFDRAPSRVVELESTVLTTSLITDNLALVGDNYVPSSYVSLDLAKDIQKLADTIGISEDKDFEKLDITFHSGKYMPYGLQALDGTTLNDSNTHSLFLDVKAGDVLEFDYNPIYGYNLSDRNNGNEVFGILAHSKQRRDAVYSYRYECPLNTTLILSSAIPNTVRLNGLPVGTDSYSGWLIYPMYSGLYRSSIIHLEDTNQDTGITGVFRVRKGDCLRITNGIKGAATVLLEAKKDALDFYLTALAIPTNYPLDTIDWVATEDAFVFINGYVDSTKIYIKRAASLNKLLLDKRIPLQAHELGTINIPEKETVFATHLNYILRMVMVDGVENIAISTDLGDTYTYIVNTTEGAGITNYHFFTDGTIMLSTEKKVYWTDDYLTLNESTLLDEDGSPFIAEAEAHHFFGQQNSDKPMFIDGQEVYAWGDYTIYHTRTSVWFTTDFGRTVKRAIRMKGSSIEGVLLTARHTHKVYFHKKLERFFVMTGDEGAECMLIEGILNPTAGTWQWKILGREDFFKFGQMWEDEHYTYVTTDYTIAGQKNNWGIYRVGHNYLGDKSKYRLAYKAPNAVWNVGSPYRFIADGNGNKVLMPELMGLSYITVATEGFNFKKVEIAPEGILSFIIGPNDNGDIYCKYDFYGRGLGLNEGQFLTGGTINLTKTLRASGLTNFMTGEQHFKHLTNVSE